jgi:type IV pilus assembly protein PilA
MFGKKYEVDSMNVKFLKSKTTAGFSIIELVVVVAIVALLVAIGLPVYKNYRAQSKINEIFSFAADQMAQYQQHASTGAPFNIVSTNLGNYIAVAEITGNGGTASSGGANGTVFMQLNTDSNTGAASIDPALSGVEIIFTPQTTTPTANDPTNLDITWVCTFNSGSSSDSAIASGLLSPGNCMAQ